MPEFFEDEDGGLRYQRGDGSSFPVHPGSDLFSMVPQSALASGAPPEPDHDPVLDGITAAPPEPMDDAGVDPEGFGPGADITVAPDPSEPVRIGPVEVPGEAFQPPQPPAPAPPTPGEQRQAVYDEQTKLLKEQGQRAVQRTEQVNQAIEERDKQVADRNAGYMQLMDEARANTERDMLDYRKHLDEFRSMRADPKKWLRDKSTLSKFALAASVMLGGYDAPLRGGRNYAMEMIEKGIEREMKAQEANIASARTALGLEQNLLKMNQDRYQNYAVAYQQTTRMLRQQAIDNIERLKRDAPEDVQLKVDQQLQALKLKQQQSEGQIARQRMADHLKLGKFRLDEQASRRANIAMAEQMRMNRENLKLRKSQLGLQWARRADAKKRAAALAKKKAAMSPKELRQFSIRHPGTGKLVAIASTGTVKELEQVRGRLRFRNALAKEMRGLITLTRKHGRLYSGPKDNKVLTEQGRRVKAAYYRILNKMVKLQTGAQMSKDEVDRIMSTFPPPQSFTDRSSAEQAWKDALGNLGERQNEALRSVAGEGAYDFKGEWTKPFPKMDGDSKVKVSRNLKALKTSTDDIDAVRLVREIANNAESLPRHKRWDAVVKLKTIREKWKRKGFKVRGGPGVVDREGEGLSNPAEAAHWAMHKLAKGLRKKPKVKGIDPRLKARAEKSRKKQAAESEFRKATEDTSMEMIRRSRRD